MDDNIEAIDLNDLVALMRRILDRDITITEMLELLALISRFMKSK